MQHTTSEGDASFSEAVPELIRSYISSGLQTGGVLKQPINMSDILVGAGSIITSFTQAICLKMMLYVELQRFSVQKEIVIST